VNAFTAVHVLLSLVGILSGLMVLVGSIRADPMPNLTLVFLTTTFATSITGFFFPYHGLTPALTLGVLSSAILIAAISARYVFLLAGRWRWVYVVSASTALYFNSFVLVVQAFAKIPTLHQLAPNGSEPAFVLAQGSLLVGYLVAGWLAVKGFRRAPV
jgi:hypothetical protein